MDDGTTIDEYLEKLFPISLIFANVCGVAISFLLLKLLASTRLHVHCKFLLKTWISGYLLQFLLHIALFSLNVGMDALPQNKADPPIRAIFHAISLSTQLITGPCELLLAIERIISSIEPDKYYRLSLSWKLLYPVTALISVLAFSHIYIAGDGQHILFISILTSLDFINIIVNFCAKRYCNRRYIQLHCKATLNGRYQVKEAADLATSLQKVYSFSILLRTALFAPNLLFCYTIDAHHECVSLWFPVQFAYMEFAYFSVLTISSLYVVIGFIRIHPRLYRKFEILLQRIRGAPVTIISHSDAFVAQERTGEGDVYFETLMKNWNETMSRK